MEIIEPSHHEWEEEYCVSIQSPKGWGFSFDCDKEGNIFFKDGRFFQNNPAWANLNIAIAEYCDGNYSMSIADYSRDIYVPAFIRCTESVRVVTARKRGEEVTILDTHYEPCNTEFYLGYGGYDEDCPGCGQPYNCFGQRLRRDWADNPSNWDDEIGDLEGYEIAALRREQELEWMEEV